MNFIQLRKEKKVNAIFGFCDIRNFTDLCEVLRQETMVFTNKVAEIVHEQCHRADGDVNKNIGDAFLVVWKLKSILNSPTFTDKKTQSFSGADMARKLDSKYSQEVRKKERRSSYVHHLSKKKA